ncbi:MAG: heterodisulfide reductase-related iron-sulfur binding cluster [Deltaproteobacteria bacterium]
MKEEKSLSSPTARQTPGRSPLKTIIEKVTKECTDCGLCRKECGFLEKYGTPKEIVDRYDPGTKEGQVMPFECSLCRLCDAVCPFGVEPSEMFLEMRRESVDRGAGSFPEHGGLLAYEGKGMSRRFTWYGLPEGCRTVLFPGCAMPGTRPARTRELYEILREQDQTIGIVFDCCGKISHDLGRERFFHAMFDEMRNYLMSQGVREVLVVCPNCHDIFSRYGAGLNIRTVYESLPKSIVSGALKSHDIVIHDPCGVRFHTDTHATIRRLVGMTGVTSQEMDHAKERTLCCGSGAGVNVLSPELADRWLERTRKEAGNCRIVTYCAGCAGRLSGKEPAVHALDVLCEPEAALAGKSKVSGAPFTYLNRLRIKHYFKKAVNTAVSRERTYAASEGKKKGWVVRLGILFGPFWGVIYTITSSTIGACIAFIVFSSSLLDLVRGKISATLIIGIALIVLVSLIPLFYRRYQKKKGIEDPL